MKILGHRGARHEAPENTIKGIELALDAGVLGIEIDVQPTADGRLAVIHDPTLDRTTNGSGKVSDHDWATLRSLDAGEGEQIPSLDEVLECVKGKAHLFVELKSAECEARVVEHLQRHAAVATSTVKSFCHPWLERVKALDATIQTACLIHGRPSDPVGLVRAAQADALSLSIPMADADLVARCHEAGIPVCAWNCNDPADLQRLRDMGLDWLGTDLPSTIVPAFESLS